jgi:DNA-directed RNA polymerase specialized sigma24 family protein
MSAAIQLPPIWAENNSQPRWLKKPDKGAGERKRARAEADQAEKNPAEGPAVSLAFYRRHTESLLRRYLYASMQVGRAPSLLGNPVARGWASSRPVRSFEDAVIFVLDVEQCLDRLNSLDRVMLFKVVLQEYTQAEAAVLMGMSVRTISYKFPQALDRLTGYLLESGLLVLPQ